LAFWFHGTGKDGKSSDLDIAILFKPGLSKYERFDLRLAGRETDMVDMEAAPLYLQHQVRKTGRLIAEKDHTYRVNFDIRSRREYFDLAPVLERRNRKLIEQVIGGVERWMVIC
jgi:hypothetical protein